MQRFPYFLKWVSRQLLVFFFAPVTFALVGIVIGILARIEPDIFAAPSPFNSRFEFVYDQILYLLGPGLTGGILGALSSGMQFSSLRKINPRFHTMRWILFGSLGMVLAFIAFAWASNAHLPVNNLLLASLFSASVYGLTTSFPQSRYLKTVADSDSWYWFLFSTLAVLFSFALICSPVWIADGPAYFWLIFPLSTLGGALYGFMTGLAFTRMLPG